jgi:hypothetical protein
MFTFTWTTFSFAAACLLFAAGCDAVAAPNDKPAAPAPPDSKGFAVVELFTSEGCSSCPPADKLLADLAADARRKNQPVYFLSFHVDYWNHLGWTDPFSDPAYSQRQRDYAQSFRTQSIYTPQMIVNGRTEFVGSDRAAAQRAIAAALSKPAAATIDLKAAVSPDGKTLTADYCIHGAPAGSKLNLALVESSLKVNVPHGGNAGRTLPHANVVRAFKTADVPADGAARLELPVRPDVKLDHAEVVGYLQTPDGAIAAAAASQVRKENADPRR